MTFQNKKLGIATAIVAILFGVILFVGTAVHALLYTPEKEITNLDTLSALGIIPSRIKKTTSKKIPNIPVKVIIPKAHVDAVVQDVGISFKGNMSAPYNFTDVGWYRYGTIPGNIGSAVMDGHVDDGVGLDGVFKHLKDLVQGDDVFVVMQNGQRLHYVVERSESYYFNQTPMSTILSSSDTVARLNFITCDGSWLPEAQTNNRRLVVYTKLIPH